MAKASFRRDTKPRQSPNPDRATLLGYKRTPQPGPYMLVAIDPGTTTGMAFRCEDVLSTCLTWNIDETIEMLNGAHRVVIERFATGAMLSTYGLQTIEIVGTVKGWCYAKGIDCRVVVPQARKMRQTEAESYIGTKVIPEGRYSVHQADALAHLLAFEARNPNLGAL